MAELIKKLHFKQDAIEQTAKAYSATTEAGTEYIENKIDGVICYVATGDTTDERATIGLVKKSSTAAERAILSTGKPPYTEHSWTTPGTYTWTCPQGVTRVRVAVCGGGGGVSYCGDTDADNRSYTAGTGGISSFDSLISATGGNGGSFYMIGHSGGSDNPNWYEFSGSGGSGGSPNGKAGNFVYQNEFGGTKTLTSTGGTGFALSFTNVSTSNGYGNGGYATLYGNYNSGFIGVANAAGGSGGYNTRYVNVTAGTTYSITVGNSGNNSIGNVEGNGRGTPTNAKSGFVYIAFGGDI